MVMFGETFDYPASDEAKTIDFVNINTLGNAQYFGDLTSARDQTVGCASATRGLRMGGNHPAIDIIEYVTIAAGGNSIDLGILVMIRNMVLTCSSSTRGFIMGGWGVNAPDLSTQT